MLPWPSMMMTSWAPFGPRRPHRVLDLAGHEVVDDGVEDDAVAGALHPRGLTGPDHLGADAAGLELVGQQPGGGPLAHRRIGPEQGHLEAPDLLDLAGEEVELAGRSRFADVEESDAAFRGKLGDLGVVGQVVVETGDHVETELDGAEDVSAG